MQRICPRVQTVVMAHGVEVWKPLGPFAVAHFEGKCCPRSQQRYRTETYRGARRSTRKNTETTLAVEPEIFHWPMRQPIHPCPQDSRAQGRVILTVGRWAASEQYKGADELIRCVSHLVTIVPGLHLVAVGAGDDLSRLQRLVASHNVVDRVHFLENLSREEIAACYANAELFALPSTGEGFGLVFLEAMAFSKPVSLSPVEVRPI